MKKTPADPAVYVALADLYVKRGELKAAVEVYDNGLAVDWDNGMLHSHLAAVAMQMGDARNALLHAGEALRVNPDDVDAHLIMGDLLAAEHLDEALAHYAKALAKRPGDADILNRWGAILMAHGRLDEAQLKFDDALAINPKHAGVHNNLGYLLQLQGHTDEAIVEYQAAIRNNPQDAGVYYNLAGLFAALHQERNAIQQYHRALARQPHWPDAQAKLAILLAGATDPQLRDMPEALHLANQICQEAALCVTRIQGQRAALPRNLPSTDQQEARHKMEENYQEAQRDYSAALQTLAAVQMKAGDGATADQTWQEAVHAAVEGGQADKANELRENLRYYRAQRAALEAAATRKKSNEGPH